MVKQIDIEIDELEKHINQLKNLRSEMCDDKTEYSALSSLANGKSSGLVFGESSRLYSIIRERRKNILILMDGTIKYLECAKKEFIDKDIELSKEIGK